jgi:glycosyltransferase involved in cell wall biosynthesis
MGKRVGIIIPLKSKQVSDNWVATSALLEQTLHSIRNQTSVNVEVVICCHEKPLIAAESLSGYTLIECTLPLPVLNKDEIITHYKQIDYIVDKTRKICMGLQHLKKKEVEYYFVLDADDLIHKELLSYVLKEADPNGYIITKGYEYFVREQRCIHKNHMDKICGSTAIIHKKHVQIPEELIDSELWKNPWGRLSHGDIQDWFTQNSIPLKEIPFNALLYKLNHGQNASDEFRVGIKYKIKEKVKLALQGKRIDSQIVSAFSMHPTEKQTS